MRHVKKTHLEPTTAYGAFDRINGQHDLQQAAPGTYISYRARKRKGGKVAFFHFDLAKEMGLIPADHATEISKELEAKILDTFSLVIVNEYDQIHKTKFPKEDLKENFYMATRYLQLQHPDGVGQSSGDGRSIWNGQITHNNLTWDISSCGTGATCLSPATSIHKKFFKTGDPSISYGCGYSEVDEGMSTLFMSEIFKKNHIPTERVLAIIEFPGNIAINIRANPNLLRPSHLFLYLKQEDHARLEKITEYYIQRQIQNKVWKDVPKTLKPRLEFFLERMTETFARAAARFEDDYIFCWLDWDGDNILMDGGIIDYGSIRQFGLFHHEYRYDDVQRFSTSLLEQKNKAKYIVQTFAQMVDYLITGEKKPIKNFQKHACLEAFDKDFDYFKDQNLMYKVGFSKKQQEKLMQKSRKEIQEFRKVFSYFEMSKSKKGIQKVADGINWSAIFCMRDILRTLPQLLLVRENPLVPEEFLEIIRSSYATKEDLKVNRDKFCLDFQEKYMNLVEAAAKAQEVPVKKTLLEVTMRSSIINKYDRITGDSVICIVAQILEQKPKLKAESIFELSREIAHYQNMNPDIREKKADIPRNSRSRLMQWIQGIVKEMRESI